MARKYLCSLGYGSITSSVRSNSFTFISKGMVEAGEVRRNFADKTHLHKLLTEAVKKEKFMFARRVIGFLVHNEYRGEKPEHRCKKDGKILQNILVSEINEYFHIYIS